MLNRPKMKYWRTNEICDLKKNKKPRNIKNDVQKLLYFYQ